MTRIQINMEIRLRNGIFLFRQRNKGMNYFNADERKGLCSNTRLSVLEENKQRRTQRKLFGSYSCVSRRDRFRAPAVKRSYRLEFSVYAAVKFHLAITL